ncbi:hypothetical protein N0V90_005143 [Kalmusia sp. IMI 367209]|nr:hypothetical protein N0V90_005143 [Kalmusia sp. IMI 367209]
MRYTSIAAAVALACASSTSAHSWVQQLRSVDDNGKYVGNFGYPRGLCAKGDPSCDPGIVNNWLLPDPETEPGLFISDKSLLCKASQRKAEQVDPDKYPRLKAIPGMHIALRYSENGHVSLNGTPAEDTNKWKPSKGGTVFVYGTTDPKEDEKLVDVLHWTQDGSGGDSRGVLLGTNDFDDGRCYESNNSPIAEQRKAANPSYAMGQTGEGNGFFGIPCESNILFPKNAAAGKPYTLYWVWQWNTRPNLDPRAPEGKDQYYTTCMDVDVVDTFSSAAKKSSKFPSPQQDDISVAVSDFASRTAIYTNAIKGEIGPYFKDNQSTPDSPSASVNPSAPSASVPTGIPNLTDRPGRPQPTSGGNADSGIGNGPVVTVTDIVFITVIAPTGQTTLATSVLPSSVDAPGPTDIPNLTERPGRLRPSQISLRGNAAPQVTARAEGVPFRGRFYRE